MPAPVAEYVGWVRYELDGVWQPWEAVCSGRCMTHCWDWLEGHGHEPSRIGWGSVVMQQGQDPNRLTQTRRRG